METGGLCCAGRQRQRRVDGAGEARACFAWSLAAVFDEGRSGEPLQRGEELLHAAETGAAELGGGAWLSHLDLRIGETLGVAER